MELYVVSEYEDIFAVVETLDGAKLLCDTYGYDRITKFKLNNPKPLKQWIYDEYYKKWEEFDCD